MQALLHSVPPTLLQATTHHASAGHYWTLMGKSGSVSCGVLVHTRFCLCPPRVCFQVLCKFWQLYGGVNGDLLQEGLCHTQVYCTQSPCPLQQSTADLYLLRRHLNTILSQSLWGLWVLMCTKYV